jgi:multidrug resistance efflux pump
LPWAETPALERLRPEPVEAAQQQVAQAEINLRRTQVRSPVNG